MIFLLRPHRIASKMAVAGEVVIVGGEDGLVAVRRDVIVDPENDVVAEVERVLVAREDDNGNVAVMQQNRVRAVKMDQVYSCAEI